MSSQRTTHPAPPRPPQAPQTLGQALTPTERLLLRRTLRRLSVFSALLASFRPAPHPAAVTDLEAAARRRDRYAAELGLTHEQVALAAHLLATTDLRDFEIYEAVSGRNPTPDS